MTSDEPSAILCRSRDAFRARVDYACGSVPLLDEHRIAELVRAIVRRLERRARGGQRALVQERAQKFVVAAAGFVRAREDGLDEA